MERFLALDVLHDQVIRTDIVDLADVGMIERSDGVSFLLETRCVLALQAFDGDGAVEPRVTRLVNLSHASRTNGRRRKDFVRAEFVAWLERHTSDLLSVRGREADSARMTGHPELAVFSVAPRPRHAFTNAPPVD